MRGVVSRSAILTGLLLSAAILPCSPAIAGYRAYYVNNQVSSCSDSGPATQAQPWCSFNPVNAHGPYEIGDSILLARGATWNQQIDVTGTGSANGWITLGAYGSGANPRIIRNQGNYDLAVRVTNPDYWLIEHLEVGRAAAGIQVLFTTTNHLGLRISDIYAHDIRGIASSHTTSYPRQNQAGDPQAYALKVNESSGVLITHPTYPFSLPTKNDYILKGVVVSLLRGLGNNNTLTFVNYAATPDGESSSGFQEVDINALDVSLDDGHIAAPYSNALLGCANSLAMTGVTRARVHDSTMFQGAACYTRDGTAQVYLAHVEDVEIVNNSFIGTPPTGSPDMTAIDYEGQEKNVNLFNNYFASNAGPGVEILNIHEPDFTTAKIDGNTFSNNNVFQARLTSDHASIHQGGYAVSPNAMISNNIYTEPNKVFFGGDRPESVQLVNNMSLRSTANYGGVQFASAQGVNQWRYQYLASGAWSDMPNFLASFPSGGAWYNLGGQYVGRTLMAPVPSGDVARVWVAPHAGIVSIRSRLRKADIGNGISAGNGITASIQKASGSGVSQVWPTAGGAAVLAGTDQIGVSTTIDNISVAAGDQLRFVVGSNGADNAYDTVSWVPSIGYTSSPTTPYLWTFATPTNYEGWAGAYQMTSKVADGVLTLSPSGPSPFIMTQDNLGLPASVRYLRVRMQNQTANPNLAACFTTTADTSFSPAKCVGLSTVANATGFSDYAIDMGGNSAWAGTIKQISFHPPGTTGSVLLDSVALSTN